MSLAVEVGEVERESRIRDVFCVLGFRSENRREKLKYILKPVRFTGFEGQTGQKTKPVGFLKNSTEINRSVI